MATRLMEIGMPLADNLQLHCSRRRCNLARMPLPHIYPKFTPRWVLI